MPTSPNPEIFGINNSQKVIDAERQYPPTQKWQEVKKIKDQAVMLAWVRAGTVWWGDEYPENGAYSKEWMNQQFKGWKEDLEKRSSGRCPLKLESRKTEDIGDDLNEKKKVVTWTIMPDDNYTNAVNADRKWLEDMKGRFQDYLSTQVDLENIEMEDNLPEQIAIDPIDPKEIVILDESRYEEPASRDKTQDERTAMEYYPYHSAFGGLEELQTALKANISNSLRGEKISRIFDNDEADEETKKLILAHLTVAGTPYGESNDVYLGEMLALKYLWNKDGNSEDAEFRKNFRIGRFIFTKEDNDKVRYAVLPIEDIGDTLTVQEVIDAAVGFQKFLEAKLGK